MSYLNQPTSKSEYGLVKVGDFINVDEAGVISSPAIVEGPGVKVSYTSEYITISATGADLISVQGTTTSYTATNDDEYIGVNSVGAVTITLPVGVDGRVYYIKDEHGQGSGKITIKPQEGEKIDGKSSYVIGVPYQCVTCVFRADAWRLI